MHNERISIWFFIGILLLAYGALILGASIDDANSPSPHPVVLSELHIGIWWGALLLLVGAFYSFHFRPGKRAK
ncbi:MAG: hypothetical protein ABUS49_06945 [Acidobacteriota bacterium]